MSSNRSVNRPITEPLVIEPQPSRQLAAGLMILHLGAVLMVLLLNGLPWPGRLFLLGLVLLSGLYYRKHMLCMPGANDIKRLTWRADGDWLLERVSGEKFTAQLLPNAYVHPWLVTLAFRNSGVEEKNGAGEKIRLAYFHDALDAELFRRLRVRLRLEARPAAGAGLS